MFVMYRLKRILGILIILGLIGAGAYYFYSEYRNGLIEDSKQAKEYEKLNKQMRALRKERETLNRELNDLYDELYVGNMGSTVILLTDTHNACLDDAVAMMEKYNYKGVVVLDYQHLPEDNKKGYLTREQIDSLVENGYELVIKAENEDLSVTYDKFAQLGYDIKGFYFDGIVVTSLMVEEIYSLDPEMVVIGNYLDSVGITDTLLIHHYGSRSGNVKDNYASCIDKSEVVALTVGYDNSINRYEEDNFESMLKTIQDYVYKDSTAVCTITEAKVRNKEYVEQLAEIDTDKYTRVNEIKERITEIDKLLINLDF